MTEPMLERLAALRLVPVVTVANAGEADAVADALLAGGLPVAEITLRTDAGLEAIRRVSQRAPDILLGAGTVTSLEDLDRVADAGAGFVVSPGLDPRIVEHTQRRGLLPLPGTASASEVQSASSLGLDAVKLFPAQLLGGPAMIDALAGPFPGMRFMPSGGVSPTNAVDYVSRRSVVAVSGSWMLPRDVVTALDTARLTALISEAVRLVRDADA